MFDEHLQDTKGLVGQLDSPPVFPQLRRLEVDLEDTEAERRRTGSGRHGLFRERTTKSSWMARILARQSSVDM
jgi:hypothetical protein